ncbi:urease accessory protein UreD [Streptomyces sp. BI20]|uniref:urease accessory protein UreD n=1 Tax=Streptomyces sp. BI20 TaxID=3403460 RepID=UPI003C77A455
MTTAPPAPTPEVPAVGVRATARIRAAADGRGGTALPVLAGEGPFALRRVRARGPEARVLVIGAMSAPLGGDRLGIEVEAEAGARLSVGAAAATLALPGRGGLPAHYDVSLTVGPDAALTWLPEHLVSVRGSDLRASTLVRTAAGSRLVFREEQVLGRADEAPGTLRSRLTAWHAGRPLLDQELSCGPGAHAGWDGPAGIAGRRALGQLLIVRPEFENDPPAARMLGETAAVSPLPGPAVLVTALAEDALALRAVLDEALAEFTA